MSLSMQVEQRNFFKRLDYHFALVILTLNFVGLINLFSASHNFDTDGLSSLFTQQVIWLSIGWIAFWILTVVDYRFLLRLAWPIYILNLGALVAVDLFGKISYGAQRWLDLGFFRYQPSETMKVALVLLLGKTFSKMEIPETGLGFKELAKPAAILAVPFILTVKQPDLGTALLLAAVAGTMVLFIGLKRKIFLMAIAVGLVTVPMAWQFGLKEYQKDRVLTFIYPGRDPRGTGYNSIQSKIAVGSGKVLGKGFRKGTQSQLEFLPERHTDFIFSVLSEEHGFIGSMTTVCLFGILFVLGIRTASHAREMFGGLLTVGLLSILFWHVFINIGMVIGILPIVGVPLPLISYGGSSLLTTMSSLGIISSVAYRKHMF